MSTTINYDHLFALTAVGNIPQQRLPPKEKHEIFMKSYNNLFVKHKKLPAIPNRTTKSFLQSHPFFQKSSRAKFGLRRQQEVQIQEKSDVSDSRMTFRSAEKEIAFKRQCQFQRLLEILRKLPFERTRDEQVETFHLINQLSPTELELVLPDHRLLKELCKVATLETYKEAGLTVFGNSGFYMVLEGCVKPQSLPYLRNKDANDDDFQCPTPVLKRRHIKLMIGDCFGTLQKIEGREPNSKVLTVITREKCELMKIGINDYKRICQEFYDEIEKEKIKLIQSCEMYKNWPNLSIKNLAALVDWKHFPSDKVIIQEGDVAPFLAFIKQGECDVFKSVDALKTLPNKRKVLLHKQVCMHKLGKGQSFGEHSLLTNQLFTCSIVTTTPLVVGCIKPGSLEDLDITTKTLLTQTMKPAFQDMTEEDIQQTFIKQEMATDWNNLKHKVLLQTINWCGIRPGYGKWTNAIKQKQ